MFVCLCVCVCVCVCVRERERERVGIYCIFMSSFCVKVLVSEMVIVNSLFGYCLNLTSLDSYAGHTCAVFSGVRYFCEC